MIDMVEKKELQDLKASEKWIVHHDTLGNTLRQHRESRGIALSEIARHLGLHTENLHLLETGADIWTLPVLARYLIACEELGPLIYDKKN